MKTIKYNLLWALIIITGLATFNRCEYPYESTTVTEDLLIGEYLEEHADTFSVFAKILQETGNMAFLKSYGEYTCFAPTNNAFRDYFAAKELVGESASNVELLNVVSTLNDDELTDFVRFYVIKGDTINSELFIDGRMNTPTMYGQYLTYNSDFEDGQLVERINKTAIIEQKDISLLNGILHSLKLVIEPEKRTIPQYIEEQEGYTIFSEALKQTGLYDELNVNHSPERDTVWYTFFAVSDEVLATDGINSVEDIGLKYAN
ncbi:MAG: fasciclin domain-containing protein, partial [Prolixibacteraceae bacterium]|nr:fasciclin domain-containing protein [Prolixibacteraceae bacterium]